MTLFYILADQDPSQLLNVTQLAQAAVRGTQAQRELLAERNRWMIHELSDGRMVIDTRQRTPLSQRLRVIKLVERLGLSKGPKLVKWGDIADAVKNEVEEMNVDFLPGADAATVEVQPYIERRMLAGDLELSIGAGPQKSFGDYVKQPIARELSEAETRTRGGQSSGAPFQWSLLRLDRNRFRSVDVAEGARVMDSLAVGEREVARQIEVRKNRLITELIRSGAINFSQRDLQAKTFLELEDATRENRLQSCEQQYKWMGFSSSADMRSKMLNAKTTETRLNLGVNLWFRDQDGNLKRVGIGI